MPFFLDTAVISPGVKGTRHAAWYFVQRSLDVARDDKGEGVARDDKGEGVARDDTSFPTVISTEVERSPGVALEGNFDLTP